METRTSLARTWQRTLAWRLGTACTARVLPLLLLLTLPATVQAQYNYRTHNGTITITKYTGFGTAVIIPSTIDGLLVTSIGEWAFRGHSNVTSVTIPNGVTSIGNGAFYDCTNLASIIIPNSVTNIEAWVFYACTSLTSISIPNNVTRIERETFNSCTSLTNVTIPDSVTGIGDGAFCGCASLTSISIPNSVTRIEDKAFGWCTSLASVTIPDSVPSIESEVFNSCTSLTNVTIPESVTSIDGRAFSDCKSLACVTIPFGVINIRYSAFSACTSLTNVSIPNSVDSIGDEAFYGCTSLANVTIPKSVSSIGNRAFGGCASLTGVYFIGNAPIFDAGASPFNGDTHATIYYLPGATGWGSTFGDRPTALDLRSQRPANSDTNKIPDHLRLWIGNPAQMHPFKETETLAPSDQSTLMMLFNETTNVLHKESIADALGRIGDETVVQLMTNVLANEFRGKELSSKNQWYLHRIIHTIALLSARHDSAYKVLVSGLDKKYWHKMRTWDQNSDKADKIERALVGRCIAGLGKSGRPEVANKLKELGGRGKDYLDEYFGAMNTAMCDYVHIKKYGIDRFQKSILSDGGTQDYFEWIETEQGKKWFMWSIRGYSAETKPDDLK